MENESQINFPVGNVKQRHIIKMAEMGESVEQRVADANKREKNNNKAFRTRKKAKIVERIYGI